MARVIGFTLCLLVASAAGQLQAPQNLRTEYASSPLYGVDTPNPRFSWQIASDDRAVTQSAYQVWVSTVSTVPSGDVWDSGVVNSTQTSQVVFAGSKLVSDQSYYWTVVYYDQDGTESPDSEVFHFHTGFFDASEWTGSWIGGFNVLRKDFVVDGSFDQATLFVCGIGYHEAYINGQKVGENKLEPGWTQYSVRSLYVGHDVTQMLVPGNNTVGVLLGGGWYGQGHNAPSRLMLQLTGNNNGTKSTIVTSDLSWSGVQGPITMDSVYNGETYDARMEQPGWDTPTFDASAWSKVTSMPAPGGLVSPQTFPAIKVRTTLPAKNMTNPQPGMYIMDFEQNLSGWIRFTVVGPAGTTIVIRHAEIFIHGSDMLYYDNLRTAKATDTFILAGKPEGETFEPRFTVHGFRFIEITGFPGVPALENFTAIHVDSSVESIASFATDNVVINQVQSNIVWGQQSNLMSVPTDCDQRDERLGWMADGHLSSEEAIHNFWMPGFYTAWVQRMTDDSVNGTIADTAPHIRFGGLPGDPAWSAAFPTVVDFIYRYYDDVTILANNFQFLSDYFDYMYMREQQTGMGGFFASYGDWVPPPPANKASGAFTSAWYFLLNLGQFIDFATELNETATVAKWQPIYTNLTAEFTSAFYHDDSHSFDAGLQTTWACALRLPEVIPAGDFYNVSVAFLNDIYAQGNHLTTGIIGTKYLMEALADIGRDDVGLALAVQTTYPSWGYMHWNDGAETPATTLWELWDSPAEGPGMNSRNHIMFGSVGTWFYSTLAGIRQKHDSRGFKRIEIRPPTPNVIAGSVLSKVSAQAEFVPGVVSSSWVRAGGVQCAAGPDNSVVTLSCNGGGVISAIQFASYGVPMGECGYYSYNDACHDAESAAIVSNLCVGQASCVIDVPAAFNADPCPGTYKMFAAQAICSEPSSYSLSTTIPPNTEAIISVSKVALSNVVITEGGNTVWQNGQFTPVAGIVRARDTGSDVDFYTGSGSYEFNVTGAAGSVVCVTGAEHDTINVQCPANNQMVSMVQFASFGTPSNTTGVNQCNFGMGKCHAGSSRHVVESYCLGKNSCSFAAEDWVFGDACYDTVKSFAALIVCS